MLLFPFATLETIKELVLSAIVSGMVTGTRRSAIGQFFLHVSCNSPRSLCKRRMANGIYSRVYVPDGEPLFSACVTDPGQLLWVSSS